MQKGPISARIRKFLRSVLFGPQAAIQGLDLVDQVLNRVRKLERTLESLEKIDEAKILTAKLLIEHTDARGLLQNISAAEFKVYSQFGDDGIIQYLIRRVAIDRPSFIEFGVENYTESNTRFLLAHNNWKGLIIEADTKHVAFIRNDPVHWKHHLTVVNAFVDRDNINDIIAGNGFRGELGLLSIDIDGNDYWIWECLEVVHPVIVIVEYNSVFGARRAVTVPYDRAFNRTKAHFSNLYWGASLKALCLVAERKGYAFVGANSHGNNAYFVRKDRIGPLRALQPEEGYVESRFRESLDPQGRLSFLSGEDRLKAIADMPVHDLETGIMAPLGYIQVQETERRP